MAAPALNVIDIDGKWCHVRDPIYTSAFTAFGRKECRNADWFKAHWDVMEPVTQTKKYALLAYKQNPWPSTRDALRAARSKSQQTSLLRKRLLAELVQQDPDSS